MRYSLFLLSLLVSCGTSKLPEQVWIEDYLKKELDDPSSYEFISIAVTDSVTYEEFGMMVFTPMINYAKALGIEQAKLERNAEGNKERLKENEANYKELKAKADSLEAETKAKHNQNYLLEYTLTCRAKNKLGALVKNDIKFYKYSQIDSFTVNPILAFEPYMQDKDPFKGF
jgi:cell division protein FtsB